MQADKSLHRTMQAPVALRHLPIRVSSRQLLLQHPSQAPRAKQPAPPKSQHLLLLLQALDLLEVSVLFILNHTFLGICMPVTALCVHTAPHQCTLFQAVTHQRMVFSIAVPVLSSLAA